MNDSEYCFKLDASMLYHIGNFRVEEGGGIILHCLVTLLFRRGGNYFGLAFEEGLL